MEDVQTPPRNDSPVNDGVNDKVDDGVSDNHTMGNVSIDNVSIKRFDEMSKDEIERIKYQEDHIITKKVIIEDEDGNVKLRILFNEGVLIGTMYGRGEPIFTVDEELLNSNAELMKKYVSVPTNA